MRKSKSKSDLVGQKFGKLLVLQYESSKGWKCQCECGNIYYSKAYYLINGRVSSCGCQRYEHNKLIAHPKKGHTVSHAEIIGKTIGSLTVLRSAGYKNNHEFFVCQCSCGNTTIVDYYKLVSKHTKSCGSNIHRIKKDLTGKRFGRLVVMCPLSIKGSDGAMWECKCDCGNTVKVSGHSLDVGWIKSCGCLKQERSDNKVTGTRLYNIWVSMRDRCNNANNPAYKNYGGRGITICKEWDSYKTFETWALNNGYEETLTIDRIDVNGIYCPQNCRWATRLVQARNKRNTLVYLYKGEEITLPALSEIIGIPYDTLHHHYSDGTLDTWLKDRGY